MTRAERVQNDIELREMMGLEASPVHVERLYEADPDAAPGLYGMVLTPAETRELQLRDRLIDDAASLEQDPGRFGLEEVFSGAFVDPERGGRLIVQVTDDAHPGLGEFRRSVSVPGRVEYVTVEHTLGELSTASDTVFAWIEENLPGSEPPADPSEVEIINVSINIHENELVIGVRGSDQSRAAEIAQESGLAERLGVAVPVSYTATELPRFTSQNWGQSTPWIGGIRWNSPRDGVAGGSRPGCTVGWPMRRSGSSDGWLLTAGHCTMMGWNHEAWHGWSRMGTVRETSLGGHSDFGLIRATNPSHVAAKIWLDYNNNQQARVGPSPSQLSFMSFRCYTGRNNTGCGQVVNSSIQGALGFDGPRNQFGWPPTLGASIAVSDFAVIRTSGGTVCAPGDSGAPVYQPHLDGEVWWTRPAGVLSAALGRDCWVAKLSNLPPSWGVSVDYY